jgi:thioredoxin reductase
MDCFEAIIIGSGPAGTAAALQLEGRNVAVLDVGFASTKLNRCMAICITCGGPSLIYSRT